MVDLTEEEKELCIKDAMIKKHAQLENDRKKRLAEEKRAEAARKITAPNELYNLIKWRGTQLIRFRSGDPSIEFEPAEFQKPMITALCLYFCNDKNFENLDRKIYNTNEYEFKLNKGLWIWGNPGVGKSLIMEMFNRNTRLCYDIVQCPRLCYDYIKFGDEALHYYVDIIRQFPSPGNFMQENKGVCYNDLGTESQLSKHYGNPINVMEHIMLDSYEKNIPYWHRHVTTNLTFDQIKAFYGVRVLDRIKECFNVIEVKGNSLRK